MPTTVLYSAMHVTPLGLLPQLLLGSPTASYKPVKCQEGSSPGGRRQATLALLSQLRLAASFTTFLAFRVLGA